MSLHPQSIQPIPPLTREVAHQAFPQGNPYMTLRDELGIFYSDLDFAELYATEGQPALRPWRLVLVCVMQYMSDLSDRGAVAAVAARIDWKYALGLELSDSGFDASVLSLFRSRLLKGGKEKLVLDKLLERCQQLNLIKARGQARTDSTHILASIRNLNRLECVGETLRAALNALAVVAPDWLSSVIEDDWFERYSKPVEDSRLPKGTEARNLMAETIGRDGLKILEELYDHPDSPRWLREVPAVETLRMTWVHQYWVNNGQLHWRSHQDLPPAGMRSNSPYDPEARYSKKRHTTWLGYKVHLSETCEKNQVHLITNVKTTEAHLADVDQTESIHQSLAQKELLPKEHLVDTGYVDGTLLVESKQQYGLDLVGPVRENVSWQSKEPDAYDLSRFKINWKTQQATCPQGVKSTKKWTVHQDQWDNTVIGIKFPRQACRECQFRHLCTRSRTEPRELTIRPQQEYLAILKRRQQQQTQKWSKQYNRRAGVEGTISQGVRALGLRNCRYVGLEKVHLQHIFTATAMNVFRLFAWFEGVPLSQTRVSSFAKLAPD